MFLIDLITVVIAVLSTDKVKAIALRIDTVEVTETDNAFNKVLNLVIVAVDVTDTDNVINLDNSLPKVMTLLDVTVNETNLDTIFDIVAALVTTTFNAFVYAVPAIPDNEEKGVLLKGAPPNIYRTTHLELLGTVTVTPEFKVIGPTDIADEPAGIA